MINERITSREIKLLTIYVCVRLVAMFVLSGLLAYILIMLTRVLNEPGVNEALTTILGGGLVFIGGALEKVGVALSRDITEWLKDNRSEPND